MVFFPPTKSTKDPCHTEYRRQITWIFGHVVSQRESDGELDSNSF